MSRIVLEDLAVCKLVNGVVDDQPWLSSVSCDTARLGNQAEVESPGSPAQKAPGKSHITCWTKQLDLVLIVDVKIDARHFEMRTSGSDIIGINSVNDN